MQRSAVSLMVLTRSFLIFILSLLILSTSRADDFHEGWETATTGIYAPSTLIPADEGTWILTDTVSEFPEDCGSTPHRADILSVNGSNAMKLISNDSNSSCSDNVWVVLDEVVPFNLNIGFSVPFDKDTYISFKHSGSLSNPKSGSPNCLVLPCGDTISLLISDKNDNILAYILQRASDAVPNTTHSNYREFFLDPNAGEYSRNLFNDFSSIPAFNPVGASIKSIEYKIQDHGWGIIDDILFEKKTIIKDAKNMPWITVLLLGGTNSPKAGWVKLFGTGSEDYGNDIALDTEGNIYITGETQNNLDGIQNKGGRDIFISKFDNDGNIQWTTLYGSPEDQQGESIALDSDKNIYLIGSTYGDLDGNTNSGSSDIVVCKFDANGINQWTKLIGTSDSDSPGGITVDKNGNVYIVGSRTGDLDGNTYLGGGRDAFITKYDNNGNKQWTKFINTTSIDIATGIAIDASDFLYITGLTSGSLHGEYHNPRDSSDAFITKYDLNGNWKWTRLLDIYDRDEGNDIAVDTNGNIFMAGGANSNNYSQAFIAKYHNDGNKQWHKTFGGGNLLSTSSLAMDSNSNSYITGSLLVYADGNLNNGQRDCFLYKFDVNGIEKWDKLFGSSKYDDCSGIAVDSSAIHYLTGITYGSLYGLPNNGIGSSDIFITKGIP